jgi:hypothetical protein
MDYALNWTTCTQVFYLNNLIWMIYTTVGPIRTRIMYSMTRYTDFNKAVITLKISYMFHGTHDQFSQNSQMLNSTMCTSLMPNSPKQTMNVQSMDRNSGAHGGTVLQPGRTWVSFQMVTGIFHRHNPAGCTMALGSTQPLTEMSTRNISWV